MDLARKQHAALVSAVRELGLDVLELPPDESNAMSVFTHELAVVVNGIALMCRPVNTSRKPEVDTMRAVLKKELNQVIAEPDSPAALLNGTDVFFTGREFFVGLSSSTNTDGAMAVAATWPEYPCTPVKIDGQFALKHYLTMAGPDVISVGSSPHAQRILKRIEREATHRYQTLTLPEEGPSNCFMLNGTLVHRCREEAPKSDAVSFFLQSNPVKMFAANLQHCRPSRTNFFLDDSMINYFRNLFVTKKIDKTDLLFYDFFFFFLQNFKCHKILCSKSFLNFGELLVSRDQIPQIVFFFLVGTRKKPNA